MPSRPSISDLTFVIDAAGRYSHEKKAPLVFAGVAVKTSFRDSIKEALLVSTGGCLKKWSELDSPKMAHTVFRFIAKHQLYIYVKIIWKTDEAWDTYFNDGQQLYEKGVTRAQEQMQYAKPMNTLKTHMFGLTASGLAGFYMGRHLPQLSPISNPIRTINITTVLDSDIHGQTNQEMCQQVFAGIEGDLPQTVEATRIKPIFRILIKTEQEEPLLHLADYIAGYFYSLKAYGETSSDERASLIKAANQSMSKIPEYCLMLQEEVFKETYLLPKETFDNVLPYKERHRLRRLLDRPKDMIPRE